jgi:hypothetical protein
VISPLREKAKEIPIDKLLKKSSDHTTKKFEQDSATLMLQTLDHDSHEELKSKHSNSPNNSPPRFDLSNSPLLI